MASHCPVELTRVMSGAWALAEAAASQLVPFKTRGNPVDVGAFWEII